MKREESNLTDDDLEAYIDGRLEPARHAEITAMLAADPKKAQLVQAMRFQNDALRQLGEEILEEPIPDRLRAVIDQLNEVEPKPGRKGFLLAQTRRRLATMVAMGMAAASLVNF